MSHTGVLVEKSRGGSLEARCFRFKAGIVGLHELDLEHIDDTLTDVIGVLYEMAGDDWIVPRIRSIPGVCLVLVHHGPVIEVHKDDEADWEQIDSAIEQIQEELDSRHR
jgi:hypothetical protein